MLRDELREMQIGMSLKELTRLFANAIQNPQNAMCQTTKVYDPLKHWYVTIKVENGDFKWDKF